jgi:hypothetical protein
MILNPRVKYKKNSIRWIFNYISQSKIYKIVKIIYICSLLIFLSLPRSNTILGVNK